MNVLVIGGTGVISRAVVAELLARGHAVTIVTRGQSDVRVSAGVEWLRQDRTDASGFARLFASRAYDAVVDMISFDARDAAQTLTVFRGTAGRIMVVSSVAVYRRPLRSVPTREDAELLWEDPAFDYGYRKAEMERYLRTEIADGVPVTIVRPSLTFGPGARNVGVLRQNAGILARIRGGKPLVMFGDGTSPWSFSTAADVARAMVDLLGSPAAAGQAFHLASQERTIWRDLYEEFGRVAGAAPRYEYLPARTLWEADPARFAHLYFEKSHPGLFDTQKLLGALPGFQWRDSLTDCVRTLVESWEEEGLEPSPELDLLEDRLVEIARSAAASVRGVLT